MKCEQTPPLASRPGSSACRRKSSSAPSKYSHSKYSHSKYSHSKHSHSSKCHSNKCNRKSSSATQHLHDYVHDTLGEVRIAIVSHSEPK